MGQAFPESPHGCPGVCIILLPTHPDADPEPGGWPWEQASTGSEPQTDWGPVLTPQASTCCPQIPANLDLWGGHKT